MIAGGQNIFILTTWEKDGGVGNSGYVWSDHTRWSADTPEIPLSILPLLFYRSWLNEDPIDLRNAEVSVYLRGDNLRLDGAECFFWVHGSGGSMAPLQPASAHIRGEVVFRAASISTLE